MADPNKPGDIVETDAGSPMLPQPQLGKNYDPTRDRERVRGGLAIGLLSVFSLLVMACLIMIWSTGRRDDVAVYLNLVLNPMVALVGTTLGFYFGGQQTK